VAGAILALQLAHHNVASIVVERAVAGPRHPGVDLLTGRSMELLRRLGLSAPIRQHGMGSDHPTGLEWTLRLADPPILASRGRRTGAEPGDGSVPVESHQWVSGTRLATWLRAALRRHPLIDLREGWTFAGLRIEADGAVAELVAAGTGDRNFVPARHVAGCDGAHSTVRRCLDVRMERLAAPARHCSVHFRSPDLARHFATRGLSTLVVGGGALVARGDRDTWIGHLVLTPDEPVATDPVAALRATLGVRLEPSEVLGVTQWDDSLAVAASYQRGPAWLVGEAAHRFHPVTESADVSVGDAVDLGWKLAAVINGWGGPRLLGTYELERRPRALIEREMLARALETRRRFRRLAEAGATRELLAEVLRQEPYPAGTEGAPIADRFASPVVWSDGAELFDRLGPELTLVDLTDDAAGRPLVAAARKRGIPMAHLDTVDPAACARSAHPLVLVRPDQHVAWHGAAAPDDWDAVLDVVTGHNHANT
jgi:2-polyprenyl-6-methoxyphenol hydroxylase-like FAD-dependent oxidoreductase